MKFILLLALTMVSVSSFAQISRQPDPDTCRGRETCVTGKDLLGRGGVFHARGEGRSCDQAKTEAQRNFRNDFGNQSCGTFGLQFRSCYGGRGQVSAWYQCNSERARPTGSRRSNCTMVGGQLAGAGRGC